MTFTDVHTDRQKLGTILENKVVQKLKFSKNDNNKKPYSNCFFPMKKNVIFSTQLNDFRFFQIYHSVWRIKTGRSTLGHFSSTRWSNCIDRNFSVIHQWRLCRNAWTSSSRLPLSLRIKCSHILGQVRIVEPIYNYILQGRRHRQDRRDRQVLFT